MLEITIKDTERGTIEEFECTFIIGTTVTYDKEKETMPSKDFVIGRGNKGIALDMIKHLKNVIRGNM